MSDVSQTSQGVRPERVGVISCGYEKGQQGLKLSGAFDVDRRAVDVAVFNAQGDRAIGWWPLYGDAEPGDVLIFNLAPHGREPMKGEVLRLAREYADAPQPLIPSHPAFTDGSNEPSVCGKPGFHGLGIVRSEPLSYTEIDRNQLFAGTVGHVVIFPQVLTPSLLISNFSNQPEFEELFSPDRTCSSRASDNTKWLRTDASRTLLDFLGSEAASLFPGYERSFRLDLEALRSTAAAIREGSAGPLELPSLTAPVRWDGRSENGGEGAESLIENLAVVQAADGPIQPIDIELDLGAHRTNWLKSALTKSAEATAISHDRSGALLIRDFVYPADVEAFLAGHERDQTIRDAVAGLFDSPENSQLTISRGALPVSSHRLEAIFWFLTLSPDPDPFMYPSHGDGIRPQVRALVLVPGQIEDVTSLTDETVASRVASLHPYAVHRVRNVLAECGHAQDALFRRVEDASDLGLASDQLKKAVAFLRKPPGDSAKGGSDDAAEPHDDNGDPVGTHLHAIYLRREELESALDALRVGEQATGERIARASGSKSDGQALAEAALMPVELTIKRLARAQGRLGGLTDRAQNHFALATAERTRRLLDQARDAKSALRVVGAITVMIAAFALYTSAAAVPNGGNLLFRPGTEAVAATILAIVIAVGYGVLIALLFRNPPRSKRRSDDPSVLALAGLALFVGVIPSLLDLLNWSDVNGVVTICAGVAGLGGAGAVVAYYASGD